MTDSKINEVINKITIVAAERSKEGESFKVTEEKLEKIFITELNSNYL